MIMHVAEVGEQRGRVVLHLTSTHPSSVAIEAAVRIAQAFQSEIESLFVEDRQLIDLAGFSFARELSFHGAPPRPLNPERMAAEMRLAAQAIHREIARIAEAAHVPVHLRQVRDDPVQALARACAERGPWNVVTIADPLSPGSGAMLGELFERITGTTGLVVVGPRARHARGPVVIVVEDADHLHPLLRAGERLGNSLASENTLLVLAESEDERIMLEEQVRLALGEARGLRLASCACDRSAPAAVAETIRRLAAGFVVGHYGGLLVPRHGEIRELATALECPLFLMR